MAFATRLNARAPATQPTWQHVIAALDGLFEPGGRGTFSLEGPGDALLIVALDSLSQLLHVSVREAGDRSEFVLCDPDGRRDRVDVELAGIADDLPAFALVSRSTARDAIETFFLSGKRHPGMRWEDPLAIAKA